MKTDVMKTAALICGLLSTLGLFSERARASAAHSSDPTVYRSFTPPTSEPARPRGLQVIVSSDGNVLTCMSSADAGRVGYRTTSVSGLIRDGKVEVEVGIETLVCQERSGVFGFERGPLEGRRTNSKGGFLEFTNLEVFGYTPDLRFQKNEAISLSQSAQTVKFVVPVASVTGLLDRNMLATRDMRVVMLVGLRGRAQMGDANTGQVQQNEVVPFGVTSVTLSSQLGTLKVAR